MSVKRLGFKQIVWIGAGLVVGYLVAGPSIMDAWAYYRWKEVPCHTYDKGRFSYSLDGMKYVSSRRDFWELNAPRNAPIRDDDPSEPNGTCWINPGQPIEAVQYLDAHKNWANSGGRLSASCFLLACVWGVLHFGLNSRARPRT